MKNRILVVDDEAEIADLVEVYLKSEGFTVFKCATGAEALECVAREALDLMTETSFHSGSVFQVSQLKPLLLLSSLQTRSDLVSERIRFLSVCDREKGSQYCETLYHYLSSGRSLKETCAALFTHRNTILYRIHKMRDEYGVPLDDPSAHLELLLGVSLALFRTKGADFFLA